MRLMYVNDRGEAMKRDIIEELFKQYYNDALLYTLSLTKNPSLAEDIVSEAFFTALKSTDGEILNFKAWLLKVCRNLFLNTLRKSKHLTELNDQMADESQTVLDAIIKREEYRSLYHAITRLKPSHKEVITLFYYENLSVKEIALVTGKSEAAVKVTLFRAREALKKILSPHL